MIRLLFFITFIFISSSCFSQALRSHVITSSGNALMMSDDAAYISIGEPMSTEIVNGDIMISQGFLQVTILGNTVSTEEALDCDIKVFPNPTTSYLQVELEQYENVKYTLIDQMGRILDQTEISDYLTTVDLSDYVEGIYYLQLSTVAKESKIVKIQKSNL